MICIDTIDEFRKIRSQMAQPLGFVPTMGYLHEGHLSLVRRARKENDKVAVSIFVNPMQFGPHEDLKTYPRDEAKDLAYLQKEGTDFVFMPSADEMYPPNFDTYMEVERITEVLEGEIRPGHFRGVVTVVAKLFNIVQPRKAYFGQKDAQQAIVIQKMVQDMCMPVDVVVCDTIREEDGLAMSSRNANLNPDERQQAVSLYRALSMAGRLYGQGERNGKTICRAMRELIFKEIPSAHIDYISIVNPNDLLEQEEVKVPALVSLAVHIGNTRLIDNIVLNDISGSSTLLES